MASVERMMPSSLVDPYEIFGEHAPSNSLPTLRKNVLFHQKKGASRSTETLIRSAIIYDVIKR